MDPYRLPDTVVPRRYVLGLGPDLKAATFTGAVRIHVEVAEPVRDIWLNAAELKILFLYAFPALVELREQIRARVGVLVV